METSHITLFGIPYADIGGLFIFWWACIKYGTFISSHFKGLGAYMIMAISLICFWGAYAIHSFNISFSIQDIVIFLLSFAISLLSIIPIIVKSYSGNPQ